MKKILLLSIIAILGSFASYSQNDSIDSICLSIEESRTILKDLARLDYLDSIIIRKDSQLINYSRLDSVRVSRIEDCSNQVSELTHENKKGLKRLKRNRKGLIIVGLVAVFEAFVLLKK